jgi:4'-phosphopantetheinyl transferase
MAASGRAEFGPIRIAWTDAAASAPPPPSILERLGEQQVRRHAVLDGVAAQRFLAGRALLVELAEQLTAVADLALTTTCARCGADHGRPRFERAPVAVSVSYGGSVVAVAAASTADAAAVGVDIERVPAAGPRVPMRDLGLLFAPAPAPDIQDWTLIEAALKTDGRGITIDLAEVRVGEIGSGRWAGSRAIRVPGRVDTVDARVVAGPSGFVLSAAMVPAAGEPPG